MINPSREGKCFGLHKTTESTYKGSPKARRFFPNTLLVFLFFLAIGLLAGCESDSEDIISGAFPPIDPTQATNAATSSVSGKANNAIGAVGRSVAHTNTQATNSVITMVNSFLDDANKVNPLDPTDPDPSSLIESQLSTSIKLLFSGNSTVDGNRLTFDPDESQMCADQGLSLFYNHLDTEYNLAKQCIDLYRHITLVLIIQSLTTIDVMYDTNVLTTIDIDDSANSLTNRINLLFLRAIIGAMIVDGLFDVEPLVPEVWNGVVGFTATEFGEDNANIRWFVDEEIKIFDAALKYDVTVPIMPNYLDVTANGGTGDLAFTTNILDGIVHGSPETVIGGTDSFQVDTKWNAWDGSYNLGPDRNILEGFTSPISVTRDVKDPVATTDPIDWKLDLGRYQWNLNGLTDTFKFTASYSAHFESNDVKNVVNKGQRGSFDLSKLAGTELKFVTEDVSGNPSPTNARSESRFEVTAGAVNFFNGTGLYRDLNIAFDSFGEPKGGTVLPNDTSPGGFFEADTVTFDAFLPFQRTFKF